MKKKLLIMTLLLFSALLISCTTNSEDKFVVMFDSQGGTNISSQNVLGGDTIIVPEIPVKGGYDFDGWYDEFFITDSSLEYDFRTTITSNVTLHAKWTEILLTIYTVNVDTELATFRVMVDHVECNNLQEIISVTVEMTALSEINHELYTSSFGEEGIIEIRIISIEDKQTTLYSEYYDVLFTDDILNVHLNSNDSLTRTIMFARTPFHGGMGEDPPSVVGLYKIQIALFMTDVLWIDTGITINVVD